MSAGRSPTTTVSARSTPSSRSRSASHGPLRSSDAAREDLGAGDDDAGPRGHALGLPAGRALRQRERRAPALPRDHVADRAARGRDRAHVPVDPQRGRCCCRASTRNRDERNVCAAAPACSVDAGDQLPAAARRPGTRRPGPSGGPAAARSSPPRRGAGAGGGARRRSWRSRRPRRASWSSASSAAAAVAVPSSSRRARGATARRRARRTTRPTMSQRGERRAVRRRGGRRPPPAAGRGDRLQLVSDSRS